MFTTGIEPELLDTCAAEKVGSCIPSRQGHNANIDNVNKFTHNILPLSFPGDAPGLVDICLFQHRH